MSDKPKSDLMSTEEAATHLNMSRRTLEQWRMQDEGPEYLKIGRTVRYSRTTLDLYVQAAVVTPGV